MESGVCAAEARAVECKESRAECRRGWGREGKEAACIMKGVDVF